jgi:acyl transferase domain-containing protein/phosphopantetheinyl transferase
VRGEVAIIGMAALFPGAPDLTTFWQNILRKVDAVTDPPPEAWDPSVHYDPTSTANDRVYCQRGGYLGPFAYFNPVEHGVMPLAVDGGEPDQWLALKVARAALADAGYLENLAVRHRTAVVIGKGTYINRGNLSLVQHGLVVDQTLNILRRLHPEYGERELSAIRDELKRHLPPFTTETVPGLIPNIIAGRIANRLDLMGPSYTVDAACASSLIALQIAMRDLLTGECDLALVGGSQVTTPVPIFTLFCQLNALSRRQEIRPFDKDADGTILGEGIGMVVLKRREDAERDGDRIYALVKGVGTASDGRAVSVMAPRLDGEELALRRAYEAAGVDPTTVELIEAHGTGTPVGDATEIQALTRVFGPRDGAVPRCAIGSVKSMIGHTMPAAGIAGLIKAALSLYHRVLPPTLHVSEPNPRLGLHESRFYVNTEVRPWVHGDPRAPRRAGVNAFGFGGINAHAVLEEYPHADETRLPAHQLEWDSEAIILQGGSPAELGAEIGRLLAFLESGSEVSLKDLAYTLNSRPLDGGCRLGLVATDRDDLRQKLERARQRLESPNCRRIKDVAGIYYFAEPLARQGKLAVLFPGEGAQYPGMLADLCVHFPELRAAVDEMDRVFWDHPRGYRLSDLLFPPSLLPADARAALEARLWQIDGAVEAVLTANQALWSLLQRLGLRPDAIVGHSTGEYSAMRAAGVLDLSDQAVFARFARDLNEGYQEALAGGSGVPPAAMLAVGAEREQVEAIARQVPGALYVAMDNCPHQAVIVGERAAVEQARALVQQEGWLYEFLTFDRAYHTPLFAPYTAYLRQAFERVPVAPPCLPIYSCTTVEHYPTDPEAIRHLMVEHWVQPVEFRRTIERLYADGVRLFVEVGPRGNLSAFVEDILRGRSFCAVPVNVPRRSGLTQLNHAVAMLVAQGVDLDLAPLYQRRRPQQVAWDGGAFQERGAANGAGMKLATGFPVLSLSDEVVRRLQAASLGAAPASAAPGAALATGTEAVPAADTDGAARASLARGAARLSGDGSAAHAEGAALEAVVPAPLAALHGFGGSPTPAPAPAHGETPATPEPDGGAVWAAGLGAVSAPADDAAAVQGFLSTMEQFLAVQEEVLRSYLQPTQPGASAAPAAPDAWPAPVPGEEPEAGAVRYPLLGEIVAWTPGEALVTRRTFDPADDLYLRDHTLGRAVSDADGDLLALAVMPLTMSLEILAEAAAYVVPGRVVTGMRDIRAYRWIAFDGTAQVLEIAARRLSGRAATDDQEPIQVRVQIRNLTEDAQSDDPPKSPVVEATVLLADGYPPPPAPLPLELVGERPSRWISGRLYLDAMFHGPCWQGVASIDRTGANGTVATLPVLPFRGFFRRIARPHFEIDPVVLDAAGQVIGFWTMEHLPVARLIFPFRVAALEVYGPLHPAGEPVTCLAAIQLIGEQQVRSDIDMVDAAGRLWMRLVGWEDKRFELPERFYPLLLSTRQAEVSEAWPEPIAHLPAGAAVHCRRASAHFPSDRTFWKQVWAQCILSRSEREQLRRLRGPEHRQLEWLAGRMAAKEAVRFLLRRHCGIDLLPADIELYPDERGRPLVRLLVDGTSGDQLGAGAAPVVSIAHTDGEAVALAALDPGTAGGAASAQIGIDVERLRGRLPELADLGFDAQERQTLLQAAALAGGTAQEWALRGWCAKEAAGKALGYGLVDGPSSVVIAGADGATGGVMVRLAGQLARHYPALARAPLHIQTGRYGDLVVASAVLSAWPSTVAVPAATAPSGAGQDVSLTPLATEPSPSAVEPALGDVATRFR